MRKKEGIYIVIAIIVISLIVVLEYNSPKEVNWFPSYVSQHKTPYGTYVLNVLMGSLFPEKTKEVYRPAYEFLSDNDSIEGTYFFVNNKVLFGESELNYLLDWTSRGNTLFIASNNFEEQLLDTLKLDTSTLYGESGIQPRFFHQLVNPILKTPIPITYKKEYRATYFNKIDTLNTKIIGIIGDDARDDTINKEYINVIKQSFGSGEIILTTFPKSFTNYFILKNDNKDYTAGLLSYIDDSKTILIDKYYKSGKAFYSSPMHIFLNAKELKWAYYIVLIGAFIYVVFEGKKKQRAIPIITPLKNQTLIFTRTIGDMYFKKGAQNKITNYKIDCFLEYIRSNYYLDTLNQDASFYRNLAMRTNHSEDKIKQLFKLVERLKNKDKITDTELKKLNSSIENFKSKADGKQ